jgi:hypothetical protein
VSEDKENEEEKFDFTPEGEGLLTLGDARMLAVRTAAESPGDYGSTYQGVAMVFEVLESGEDADYYTVTLSVRPQGNFVGTAGQEQFLIGQDGTIAVRQVLSLPTQTSASPADTGRKGGFPMLPVAIGVVVVGIIAAVGVVFVMMGSGGDNIPIAVPAPTETPAPIESATPTTGPTAIPATDMATSTPMAAATPMPTYTPFQTATPRPTATPSPTLTVLPATQLPTPVPQLSLPTSIPTPGDLVTYVHPTGWWQIDYPTDWEVSGENLFYAAFRPPQPLGEYVQPQLSISRFEGGAVFEYANLDTWQSSRFIDQSVTQIVSSRRVVVSGLDAFEEITEWTKTGAFYQIGLYLIVGGDTYWVVAAPNNWPDDEPLSRQLLYSFRLLPTD